MHIEEDFKEQVQRDGLCSFRSSERLENGDSLISKFQISAHSIKKIQISPLIFELKT